MIPSRDRQKDLQIEFLLHVQDCYQVSRWHVLGVDLWPFLRVSLGRELKAFNQFASRPFAILLRQKVLLARQLFELFFGTRPAPLRVPQSVDGCFYEPRASAQTLEPIRALLEDWGFRTCNLTASPRTRPSLRELVVAIHEARGCRVPQFEKVASEAQSHIGRRPPSLTRIGFFFRLVEMRLAVNRFRAILHSVETKKILTARSLVDSIALIAAGRQSGIPVVLVQGGLLNVDRNYMCARWNAGVSNSLPDIYWAWTRAHADAVLKNHLAESAVVGGNTVFIDAYRRARTSTPADGLRMASDLSFQEQLSVLVILQDGVSLPMQWLENLEPCAVTVRQHPGQGSLPKEVVRWLTETRHNVSRERPEDSDLVGSLKRHDVAFTGWSASLYECGAVGVPAIVPKSFERTIGALLGAQPEWIFYSNSSEQFKKQVNRARLIGEEPMRLASAMFRKERDKLESSCREIMTSA